MAYFTASCDDVETNTKFAESLQLDYPILSDPEREVADAYGILKGRFASRVTFYIGKDGKILYIDSSVSARSAGADLASKLKELGVEEN